MQFADFHWIHGAVFAGCAVVHTWSWARGGFWVPRYVHMIALLALFAGVVVTATLPQPTNPNPIVHMLFPFVFPVLFVVSTYAIAILCGFVEFVRRIREKRNVLQSQESENCVS